MNDVPGPYLNNFSRLFNFEKLSLMLVNVYSVFSTVLVAGEPFNFKEGFSLGVHYFQVWL